MKRALAILVGLAACGGGGGAPSIDELPGYVIDTLCASDVECDNSPDLASCKAAIGLDDDETKTIIADVKAGIIIYDGEAAKACFDARKEAGCTFTGLHAPDDSACQTYFKGTVAVGGACFIDLECADGGGCRATDQMCDTSKMCCPGTCEAGTGTTTDEVAIGAMCDTTEQCPVDGYCKGATDTAKGTCTAVVTQSGAACDDFYACANPMICNQPGSGPGSCYTPAAEGATCDPDAFFGCLDERDQCDSMTMKCVRVAAVGAACSENLPCVGYATCTNMICVADPRAGEACDATNGPSCIGDLDCVSGSCALPAPGSSCR